MEPAATRKNDLRNFAPARKSQNSLSGGVGEAKSENQLQIPPAHNRPRPSNFLRPLLLALVLTAAAVPVSGNTSGIATAGPGVTVKDNGDGTVTMANGIVSILIETAQNRINSIQYTSSNSGTPRTVETVRKHEHFRWGGFPLGGSAFVYSLAVDPATNGGACGDVMLLNTSDNKGVFEIHYSMLRGSSGFYTTGTLTHRAQDAAGAIGAWGALVWVPADFDWVSLNARHNYWVGPAPARAHGIRVPDSAHVLTVQLHALGLRAWRGWHFSLPGTDRRPRPSGA
jgi:hypothetical protein